MDFDSIKTELKKQVKKQGYAISYFTSLGDYHKDEKSNYRIFFNENSLSFIELYKVHKPVPDVICQLHGEFSITLNESSCDMSWIMKMKEVVSLRLFYTKYKDLPREFSNLKSLKILRLVETGLNHLPDVVREITSLETIDMSNSGDREPFILPDWLSELPNLEDIDLARSTIHSIPADLVKTKMNFSLKNEMGFIGVHLYGTRLVEGDISLFGQPRNVIEAFYFGPQKITRECKVIFLGEGKSGKSSLIERLINDTFEENKLPTEGIRMQTWPITIGREQVRLRILDFGGQEIMHAMHRCFMTMHTVYVLVCDSRNDGDLDREAARWLETIQSFAPECPVVLALNKADENGNASVNETNLKAINPKLRKPITTSAKWERERGTKTLLENIIDAVNEVIDNSAGNTEIIQLREYLENMDQDYLTAKKYRELCLQFNITDEQLQEGLLEWFKDLGVCYYYKATSLNTLLESLHVLNPAWLTNGIYRLILRTPQNGILSHETIKDVLRATNPNDIIPQKIYTPEETEYILYVMRKFEISLAIGNGRELIPLKMTKSTPESINSFDKRTALHLSWKANYIPNTVMHRLIIRKHNELDMDCLWRFGAHFVSQDHKQSALAYMSDARIDVFVQGQDKRQYMEEFRKEIIRILAELNLSTDEMIHFYWENIEREVSYIDVLEQFRRGKTEIFIRGAQNYPAPAKILQEHYVEEERRMSCDDYSSTKEASNSYVATRGGVIVVQSGNGSHRVDHFEIVANDKEFNIDRMRESILSRNSVEQNEFNNLVDQLRGISSYKGLPFGTRLKLKGVLKQCENRTASSTWYKLRDFLGDAANLAAIVSLAVAPEFIKLLQTIFT